MARTTWLTRARYVRRPAPGPTEEPGRPVAGHLIVCGDDPLTHIAYAGTVNFPAKGLMYDNVHWSQTGQEIVGRAVARYIAASTSHP